jgi:DNA-binding MurR/RpiR family transcriptional regulator
MAESIIDRINLIKNQATKQEKVIINYILNNNINSFIYMSITEFAETVNVAEATVLRFCRKLGLKGYSEFKLMLAQSLNEYKINSDEAASRIYHNMVSALHSTYELLNKREIEKAVDFILNSRHIYSFGSGNSGLAAQELRNKMLRLGIHINTLSDSHFQLIASSVLGEQDLLILFSVSGSTKDIINIAQIAKENKTKTIIITNYLKSPLASYADSLLHVVAKSAPLDGGGSLIAKVSQLFIIDVLSNSVYQRLGGEADQALEKSASSVLGRQI